MSSVNQLLHDGLPPKILVVGDPGTGKTGGLAALPTIGYRLRVASFDPKNNIKSLIQFLKPEFRGLDPDGLPWVDINFFEDALVMGQRRLTMRKPPAAFPRFLAALNNWPGTNPETGEPMPLGPVENWTAKDVLVIDTNTHMGRAIMRHVSWQSKRLQNEKPPRLNDWGNAMEINEGVIETLCKSVPCSLIVNSHLTFVGNNIGDEDEDDDKGEENLTGDPTAKSGSSGPMMRYPAALGNKLPPKIASYFSTVVQTKRKGFGAGTRYVLSTKPDVDVDVKVPVLNIQSEFPIETGLVKIFQALTGRERA